MKSAPLRVLVVAEVDVVTAIENIVRDEGDEVESASTVDDAVQLAQKSFFDVAFVDLAADGGAVLALCHHLPSLCAGIGVHVIARSADLDIGASALSLGATSVIVAPPTGDAVSRVLEGRKVDAARAQQVDLLEQKLARERRRLETYDRLVRFARGAAPSDAVRAIVDGVAQLSSAQGVALYATFGKEDRERVLLAALGSALDMPATSAPADLARMAQSRHARVVPLVAQAGELGILLLDQAPATPEPDIAQFADLAAAMLALVDKTESDEETVRIFPPRQFKSVAERLLTLAARHDRRASVLAISFPAGETDARREEATGEVADIVRTTDALCGAEDGDLLLLLPETGGLGAHVCRRRILARLSGERRARPKGGQQQRSQPDPKVRQLPVAVGVSTFPHDGTSLKRLMRSARARAFDDSRSSVHALALENLSIAELVDALIAKPMFDAGPRSPYPLDVSCSSLFTLVTRACREGSRGGQMNVYSTLQPGLGVAAAARQVTTPRVVDVRAEKGCENLEAIVIEAEHGAWVCAGRVVSERFRGVHAADPLLADVLLRRLAAGSPHAG